MKHILRREYLIPNKNLGCICYCPEYKDESSAYVTKEGNAICDFCGEEFEIRSTKIEEPTHAHSLETRVIRVGEREVCRIIETYCSECGEVTQREENHDHDFVVVSLGHDADILECAHCGYDAIVNK